jgi:hypothetical protein
MRSSEERAPDPRPAASDPREAKEELLRRLEEACRATNGDIDDETTEELLQLEDALLAAARAADELIAARRREEDEQHERGDAGRPSGQMALASAAAADGPRRAESEQAIREFRDDQGRAWRAWAVIPGRALPGQRARRYLGDMHEGWLAFETLDGSERRRLIAYPRDWLRLDDRGVVALLEAASPAPVRKRPRAD